MHTLNKRPTSRHTLIAEFITAIKEPNMANPSHPLAMSPAMFPAISPAISQAIYPAKPIPNTPTELHCAPQSTNDHDSNGCPNRIFDFNNLKKTVNEHLGYCKTCKIGKLELDERGIDGLSSKFLVNCGTCNTKKKSIEYKLDYITKSIASLEVGKSSDTVRGRNLK